MLLGTGVVLLGRHDGSSSNAAKGVQGYGVAATVTRHLPAFDAVDLAGSNNVTVHVGGRRAVMVRADDNVKPGQPLGAWRPARPLTTR